METERQRPHKQNKEQQKSPVAGQPGVRFAVRIEPGIVTVKVVHEAFCGSDALVAIKTSSRDEGVAPTPDFHFPG